MRIQVMSDLHFEYHADRGASWIEGLDPSDVDVLILAGDIAEIARGDLHFALQRFTELYQSVIFVPGNHEYYGSDIAEASQALDQMNSRYEHLHILRGESVVISGQRFIGATLWFTDREDDSHAIWKTRLNDFKRIEGGFEPWVYQRAAVESKYLAETVTEGDVVVTHHIPSRRGVAPRWQNSIEGFGRFFVHELPEDLVTKARLWCHGHGHDSVESVVGKHRLLANPFGYLGHEENPHFNDRLIIEI